ncbi:MAG: ferritin [Desulfofustis sp.]|nr:ferritin [Desulfofustis sp.]MBT8353379.1 ferritin [Desulfofustis sp.]NNF45775.1 ferritin [Desulfofustis sp.]NNK56659.1 ferritin [Desulfofustis sp.]
MLKKEITDALNDQINKEIYSAFLYMSMSGYTNELVLKGFSNWFMVQYHEEMYHAMKLYEYVQSQGESVVLKTVEAPPASFASPLDAFEKTLAHEQVVTQSINDLMDLAIEHRDHATKIFLEWFVTEQVEEEDTAGDMIAQLKMIGDDAHAMLMMDRELAGRAANVPVDFSKGVELEEA